MELKGLSIPTIVPCSGHYWVGGGWPKALANPQSTFGADFIAVGPVEVRGPCARCSQALRDLDYVNHSPWT